MATDAAPEATDSKKKTWGATGVTGLVRHLPSGIYYHRYSIGKKRTYRSLKTARFPTAKIRLAQRSEGVEKQRQARNVPEGELRTMADLGALFLARVQTSRLKPNTKTNYAIWLKRLDKVWPEFGRTMIDRVDSAALQELQTRLQKFRYHKCQSKKWTAGYSAGSVNHTLLLVKLMLDVAQERQVIFTSPFTDGRGLFGAFSVSRTQKEVRLPSCFDMDRIFTSMAQGAENAPVQFSKVFQNAATNATEKAQFMAYSGMRHQEANASQWEDISGNRIKIHGTKSATSVRVVPIIPAFASLLATLKERRISEGKPLRGKILRCKTCLSALARACKRLGLPKLTQHDLRHYFATVCIESGVDIPTVSRWLGHADGGALALKVYGHLRDDHSQASAAKVTFGTVPGLAAEVG